MAARVDRFLQSMEDDGREEIVTVDTRALIDKVLARYSADFTTFRELIQNAADARATRVHIKFETLPSVTVPVPPESASDKSALLKHTLRHHTVRQVSISNNGQHFRPEDWSRLKNIAEGNPDETKIGAFGVGFYSVFADCEEPFVISGHRALRFFWKQNRLFTKALDIDKNEPPEETTFVLAYRDKTTPIPDLSDLCRFFCSSFTFVSLEELKLWIDGDLVFHANKKTSPDASLQIPNTISLSTADKMLAIESMNRRTGQISATWMDAVAWPRKTKEKEAQPVEGDQSTLPSLRSFFGRFTKSLAPKKEDKPEMPKVNVENLTSLSSATIFFRVTTVGIVSNVPKKFSDELERATKKPPPKRTKIEVLTAQKVDGCSKGSGGSAPSRDILSSASLGGLTGNTPHHAAKLFEEVLPLKKGRIYIGFPTSQTTGFLCHLSTPSVIPTVERESIDLQARYVSNWNINMLSIAGTACRVAYADEMNSLQEELAAELGKEDRKMLPKDVEAYVNPVLGVYRQYTASTSTPSASVGERINSAFWSSSKSKSIELLSTRGFLPSDRIRLADDSITFIQDLPLVPRTIVENGMPFMELLFNHGILSVINVQDIKREFSNRVLDETEGIAMLRWLVNEKKTDLTATAAKDILDSAIIQTAAPEKESTRPGEGLVALVGIRTYLSQGGPFTSEMIPSHTLPLSISKAFSPSIWRGFGWNELQVAQWLQFMIETAPKTGEEKWIDSPVLATKVLTILSKQWGSLGEAHKDQIVQMLKGLACMPTADEGSMKVPSETYFPQAAKGFNGLAVISKDVAKLKEVFLKALGVRVALDLKLLIKSLMLPANDDPEKLFSIVKYLASVASDIPESDYLGLRKAPVWPSRYYVQGHAKGDGDEKGLKRVSIINLFEPTDENKKLGLRVLQWPENKGYFGGYKELQFLRRLGLKASPTKSDILRSVEIAFATKDSRLYDACLAAFPAAPGDLHDIILTTKFLPSDRTDWTEALYSPVELFARKDARLFGCHVLRPDLVERAAKFGVAEDPPIEPCVVNVTQRMKPQSYTDAVSKFEYLARRMEEVNTPMRMRISKMEFVPILENRGEKGSRVTRYSVPSSVILGQPVALLEGVMDFVDFGHLSNYFLSSLGAKAEPTSKDLANVITDNPGRILDRAGLDGYFTQLRKLATHGPELRAYRELWEKMKRSPFLLAYRDVFQEAEKKSDAEDGDEEPMERTWHLKAASEVIIIGESHRDFSRFRGFLYATPQDDALEWFYETLGVPQLGSRVQRDTQIGHRLPDQSISEHIHSQIVERARVFLFEQEKSRLRQDAGWLEKKVEVVAVDHIVTRSFLKPSSSSSASGPSFREPLTALESKQQGSTVLYITAKVDFYDVANALVRLLLAKPTQNDAIALEMILSTDLRRLRNKGYNVDRILRDREREIERKSKIAEEERERIRRQRQEQEEQVKKQQTQAQETQLDVPQPPHYDTLFGKPVPSKINQELVRSGAAQGEISASAKGKGSEAPVLPPIQAEAQSLLDKAMSAFLPAWKDQFSFGGDGATSSSTTAGGFVSDEEGSGPVPPKTQELDRVRGQGGLIKGPGKPLESKDLERLVKQAISKTQPAGSKLISSRTEQEQIDSLQPTYCNATAGRDLVRTGSVPGSTMPFYLPKNEVPKGPLVEQAREHAREIADFSRTLAELKEVFGLKDECVNVYWDPGEGSNTIAFNQGGTIFCNYRFWENGDLAGAETRFESWEAWHFWYVTLCHELAHNIELQHTPKHGFFTEHLLHHFFGALIGRMVSRGVAPGMAAGTVSGRVM